MINIQKFYNYSFIIRIILNILLFIISKYFNISIFMHYILLFIIDATDYKYLPNLLSNLLSNKKDIHNQLNKNDRFYYIIVDKLCDIISYVLFLNLLDLNVDKKFYNYIILYRLIGVFLLMITQNYKLLIIIPDLFKEVIGYQLFIKNISKNISNKEYLFIIIIKVIFEYIKLKYHDKLI